MACLQHYFARRRQQYTCGASIACSKIRLENSYVLAETWEELTRLASLPGTGMASHSCSYFWLRSRDTADSFSCKSKVLSGLLHSMARMQFSAQLCCWTVNEVLAETLWVRPALQSSMACLQRRGRYVASPSSDCGTTQLLRWIVKTSWLWLQRDTGWREMLNGALQQGPYLWNVTCFGLTCLFFTSTLLPQSTIGMFSHTLQGEHGKLLSQSWRNWVATDYICQLAFFACMAASPYSATKARVIDFAWVCHCHWRVGTDIFTDWLMALHMPGKISDSLCWRGRV